ncbi:MAG: ribonuclease HII [Verrucomicrobia bacterium]|nr:ribonuclease HII [Verrucomicrobiota bacterium]
MLHESNLQSAGFSLIAGVDEAGRGPLAGPVVAAAVILPAKFRHAVLDDSKKLSARKREAIFLELTTDSSVLWSVAIVEAEEIDRLNILRATHEAMRRAIGDLSIVPDHALIDGLPVHPFPIAQTALVGGDGLSLSIAAASVIAKVVRDRLMCKMDDIYPDYGFAQHKGYGTALHLDRLQRYGPCPIHRKSFSPVTQCLLPFSSDR